MSLAKNLFKRQTTFDGDDDGDDDDLTYYDGFWYSSTAYIIKWAVIGAIFFLFIAFFVGGYMHAKRRMKRGLVPLGYHRWLIPRRHRLAFHAANPHLPNPYTQDNRYHGPNAYYVPGHGEQRTYPMGPMYGPPPPAYGEAEWVPPYAPPEGGSKVAPDQGGPGQVVGVTQVEGSAAHSHPGGDLGSRR